MTMASVVLPTFNEVDTAPAVVAELLEFDTVAEVIVVDDDSPDRTGEVVAERFADDRVDVIVRTDESGLSSAVLRGFERASAPVYCCMDADGQHPPGSCIRVAREVDGGADVAVGSRHVETGAVADDWPLHRQAISWGAAGLAWAAVPPARELSDPMSGLFAIRGDLVDAVHEQCQPHGYKILLELLARAPVEDIVEVGYTFRKREAGASNLGLAEYLAYVQHLGTLVVPSRKSGQPDPDGQEVTDGAD
jgi:glycosyltransferase involved in cell wall biosynthesis